MTARGPGGLVAIFAAALVACGGGGGGGGATPSDAPVQVAGQYAGRVLYTAATPDEHCFSAWLQSQGGSHAFSVEVELQQAGSQVTGVLRGTDIPTTCELSGTLSGRSLSWQNTGCSVPCTTFVSEPTCDTLLVCTVDQTFSGTASSGSIEGTHSVTWDAFDAATGTPAGRAVITATLSASR